MSDIRDDARAAFGELFGHAPAGLWSAPGRVNLIGEHTDYNEGFVLPFAIDRRTVVALGLREDRRIRVASAWADELVEIDLAELAGGVTTAQGAGDGEGAAGAEGARHDEGAGDPADAPAAAPRTAPALHGWSAYPLGIVWALGDPGDPGDPHALGDQAADLAAMPGVELYIDSDVPVGAGLSSSAAVECAVALALNDVWRLGLDRRQLAAVGRRAENIAVGAPTGIMDQTASLLGEQGRAVFLDCRSQQAELVELGLEEAGLSILIIDTEQSHRLVEGGYAERRASCELAARTLGLTSLRELDAACLDAARSQLDDTTFRRARHVVTENQRVLDTVRTLREQGPAAIGEYLDASHRSMRDDFEISTPELDLAVETALAHGALGARMTGGGFGGAAIALVPEELLSLLRVAIDGAFAEHGYGQPDTFNVTASWGARRDD